MNEERISSTHVWRRVSKLRVGDHIHRWGDDLEITDIQDTDNGTIIEYDDNGVRKKATYQLWDTLITREPETLIKGQQDE